MKQEDVVYIITPLARTLQTIFPFLEENFKESIQEIQKKYDEIQKIYQDLRDKKEIQSYLKDKKTQKLFEINTQLYVDFRTTDLIIPELQDKIFPTGLSTSKPTNEKLTPEGESIDEVIARCKEYTYEINKKFTTKTIVSITHRDSVILMHQTFKYFDYLTKKQEYNPNNGKISIRYRDNDRDIEVDLHKPYVDNYRFKK